MAYKFVDSSENIKQAEENSDEISKSTNLTDDTRNRHKSNECKHSYNFDEDLTRSNLSRKTKSQENVSVECPSCENTCLVHMYDNACPSGPHQAHYSLLWQRSFSCPVMGVDRLDIVGDGLDDLIVVTQKGVHIVQVCDFTGKKSMQKYHMMHCNLCRKQIFMDFIVELTAIIKYSSTKQ